MVPNTFLRQLAEIPKHPGDGFLRSHKLSITGDLRTAAGLVLTAATAPLVAAFETNALGVQVAAGQTAAGSFTFQVPLDYDQQADTLKIVVLVNSAGNTNTPILDATVYRKRAGAALSADLGSTDSAAIPSLATLAAERTIVISGKSLRPGDVLTINLITGAHATDAVNIYGVEVRYKSALVASDPASR